MERILIRAGVAPWAEYNALDVITDKIIGNNTGNLLFANSITRLVATADSRVDFISDLTLVKKQITAQEINENYDRLILPMANAFREDFARKCLKHWTALIRQLTIPVTVTGIGIQLQERNKKQAAQIQALKEERKALKTELKATKKPLRRLAWYQRTSTFGIGLARLKKKLRRLLGKEK